MAYVPRKEKISLQVKISLLLLFVTSAVLLSVYFVANNRQDEDKALQICGWSEEQSKESLKKTYTDTYTISDYIYYGESLDLFSSDYQLDGKNDLSRKSIQLVNVCNEETITYTMEAYLDRQIDLSELEDGFYELYVNDNMVKKRLIYDEAIVPFEFTGVKRAGEVSVIQLLADQQLLGKGEVLDKEYVFLQVERQVANNEDIDIYIDPYGYNMDELGGILQKGGEANGLSENQEMFDTANLLKTKLEEMGLRVEIAKNSVDEIRSYYGKDGKMADAYNKNARYYLELGMNSSTNVTYRGMEVLHSNYVSETLASSIVYTLGKNTSLTPSNFYTWADRNEGVVTPALMKGLDDRMVYDGVVTLRESGGIGTGAGMFSNKSKENESFAKNQKEGMMALVVNFIYLSNVEDANYWKENKELIVTQFADALGASLHASK